MLRKTFVIMMGIAVFMHINAWGMEFKVFGFRNKIFEDTKAIRTLISTSKDGPVLIGVLNSSIITMTQLDAYFFMLGIFESKKTEEVSSASLDFLTAWLNEIKKSNELQLKSLTPMPEPTEPRTKAHLEKLKSDYIGLNEQLDNELNKVSFIRKSLKVKPRR